jgi:hypothetical protein
MTLFTFRNWIILSILWVGFVAVLAMMNWPRLPLDMALDPKTAELFAAAKWEHALVHLGLAIAPPLVAYLFGRLACASRAKAG